MIEIVLGALLMLSGAAILVCPSGLALGIVGFDPLSIVGLGGAASVCALGAALAAWGVLRSAIVRRPDRLELRRTRTAVAGSLAVAMVVAGPLTVTEALNLVRVAGVPMGYYLAAEGALIGLVAVAFLWAARAARHDIGDMSGE